jgi:hypothetical protein
MSKLETNTIDTVSGTSTLQVGSTNTTTITLGVSGDTINVPSGVTIANSGTATGFGGDNTPAWKAMKGSSDQSIAHDTETKITYTNEVFDTDGAYDAANSKFVVPSGEGGKYFVRVTYEMAVQTNPTVAYIFVNGSKATGTRFKTSSYGNQTIMILTLSAGDYVEGYTYQASGGAVDLKSSLGDRAAFFEGFKLIGI